MTHHRPILLAEDSPEDVELILEVFRQIKLANEMIVVRDGVEALDYLHCRGRWASRPPGRPAVALLDLKMPRLDGLDVLRQIRADDALRTLPVVMMTSSREEGDILRSYSLGVNAYVVKPVDFAQFAESVKRLGVFWALVNEAPPEGGA